MNIGPGGTVFYGETGALLVDALDRSRFRCVVLRKKRRGGRCCSSTTTTPSATWYRGGRRRAGAGTPMGESCNGWRN